jgi:hypothetical protein
MMYACTGVVMAVVSRPHRRRRAALLAERSAHTATASA